MAIRRLDKLSRDEDTHSRDEDTQAKLQQTDWDLIVCDEAHKLSATYFGNGSCPRAGLQALLDLRTQEMV